MFVLQRTGKVKVRYEILSFSFFPVSKSSCFVVAASVLYYYWYKRTSEYLGDPRLYEDSPWLREAYARVRQWSRFLLELEGLCQMPVRTILSHCCGGPDLSHRDTLTSCHFFILLMKYKFMKLFWKCLRFCDLWIILWVWIPCAGLNTVKPFDLSGVSLCLVDWF